MKPSIHIISTFSRTKDENGYGVSYSGYRQYTKTFTRAFKTWKRTELGWAPKDQRNCIQDFAVSSGLFGDLWDQYVGHGPKGVAAEHYTVPLTAVSRGQLDSLEEGTKLLREHVVRYIDRAIERKITVWNLNFLEHAAVGNTPCSNSGGC